MEVEGLKGVTVVEKGASVVLEAQAKEKEAATAEVEKGQEMGLVAGKGEQVAVPVALAAWAAELEAWAAGSASQMCLAKMYRRLSTARLLSTVVSTCRVCSRQYQN